jgi:tetratricopeptide (TPR) repeat protein
VAFAKNPKKRNNMRPILFEIEIDPRSRTKAFADVGEFSDYQDEGEVLITLGALFRIDKVFEDDEDEIWIARVTLASEDDFHLKEIFDHMKGKIGDDTNLDSLGKLLLRMGENEKARKCYKRMLDETQLAAADAHLGLGWASLRCNAYDESLKNFEESLQIRQRLLGENHASVGESYSFLGEVYRKKNNYEKALIYLKKAMTIQQNTLPDDSLDLAATYDTIGNTYTTTKEYDLASNYFNKALEIRQKTLLPDHPQIAAVYNNIGWLHECQEKYSKALDYYRKAREISRKTLPPTHPHVSGAEASIQRIKTKMKH